MTCKKKPVRNAWIENKKLRNNFSVYFSRQFVGTDLAGELSQSVQNVEVGRVGHSVQNRLPRAEITDKMRSNSASTVKLA
jgi:hypothetical protein